MPNYDYHCNTCGHTHSAIVSHKEREKIRACPQCSCTARYTFPVDAINGITVSEGGYCEQLDCDVTSERDMINKAKQLGYIQAGDRVGGGRNEDSQQQGLYKAKGKSFDDKLREREQRQKLKEGWKSHAIQKDGSEVPIKEKDVRSTTKGVKVKHLTATNR